MKTKKLRIPYELNEGENIVVITLDNSIVFEFDKTSTPWICINCYIDGEYIVESGIHFWVEVLEDLLDSVKSIDGNSVRYMVAATCLMNDLTYE